MEVPNTVTLFCCEISGKPFLVDIKPDMLVGHLQDVILQKNPRAFGDVDASELTLFKVSGGFFFSLDGLPAHLSGQINEATPAASVSHVLTNLRNDSAALKMIAKEMDVFKKISGHFSEGEPKEGHLHIIVTRPNRGEYKSLRIRT
jgi:hypothetical protein